MTGEQSIFAAALEKTNPAERAAFLAEACAGNESLRAHLDRLLAADRQAAGILDRGPAASVADSHRPTSALAVGALFAGRFRLRQKLGEGGMGEVWDAEQTEPVRRRVALKVVRPDLDSRPLLARFEQERQALALMDHPNIARVLDAGIVRDAPDGPGRPFFVMEFIEGVSVTEFCDAGRLSTRERLELFVPVCQAVQHAHQKGIIHRDLKPTNILVGLYDGRPVPKVIDFGVAKATGPRLTEADVVTEVGSLIGTVEYMSPEQAELDNLDIDTRTDVYALGAILYELLTGTVPFSRRELKAVALAEVLRKIREDEPPRPSTRLSDCVTLASVAAARQTEPRKLIALMRGELDWIVGKCLEKDRNRRYETATGLAVDVQRYLADETVVARPPTPGYRLRKFVRRNRGPVGAAALVLLALIGGIVGTTVALVEARRQRDAADAAERLASDRLVQVEGEKLLTDEERAVTQATNDFLFKDLLGQAFTGNQAVPGRPFSPNPKITVRELLERAQSAVEAKFIGRPRVEAAVRETLAITYMHLGEYSLAIPHFERVLDLRRSTRPTDHPAALADLSRLAQAYTFAGRLKDSIPLLERIRDARIASVGIEDQATLATLEQLADAQARTGHRGEAKDIYRTITEVWARRRLPRDDPLYVNVAIGFGNLQARTGNPKEAIALLEDVRDAWCERNPPDHPFIQGALCELALAYLAAGRTGEAIPLFERVRDTRTKVLEADHPQTLATIRYLAEAYTAANRPDDAIREYDRVAAAQERKLPPGHIETLISLHSLAHAYQAAGRFPEAARTFERIRDISVKRYGPDSHHTRGSNALLARAYFCAGQSDRALAAGLEAAAGVERQKFNDPSAAEIIDDVGRYHEALGQYDRAEAWARKWVDHLRAQPRPEPVPLARAQAELGTYLVLQGRWKDAEEQLQPALAVLRKEAPADWNTADCQSALGHALAGRRAFQEAESHLRAGYEGLKGHEPNLPPPHKIRVDHAIDRLIRLYEAWDKPAEARKWRSAKVAQRQTGK